MSDALHVRVERDGAVGLLTLDRPARLNSLDVRTARELRKAGLQLCRDEAVRCLVVRGVGGAFCSGADLKWIRAGGEREELVYLSPEARPAQSGHGACFKQILEYLHATISELRRAPKPVIAAVDGVAAAGGLGLAMCCDLVVASERASFQYAYFKTALTGAESTTFFLPKLVGLRRALELALLDPRLSARDALQAGLVSRVLPTEGFDAAVLALAHTLAEGPTGSYAAAKRLMNEAAGVDRLDHHLDRELEALVQAADGPDFAEGLEAFFGKRAPRFAGR